MHHVKYGEKKEGSIWLDRIACIIVLWKNDGLGRKRERKKERKREREGEKKRVWAPQFSAVGFLVFYLL